ncbi:coiled-coil domain-containing protein 66 [Notolabrus celidotus]|uniref:coiled-coil domain-containing protein 66 n=1 Tax=Notolabrus celidotus TaxID=1203425 RepID=UPI00148FCB1D|nr:coiled-coil domain-containing protein 66 [Notolabrus celidotus]
MNLGDGLLFELENGKPKLILLSHGLEKHPVKPSFRHRAANVLSSRQPSLVEELQGEERPARQLVGRHRESKSKAGGANAPITSSAVPTGGKSSTGCNVKVVPKVKSDRHKHITASAPLRANGKAGPPQSRETPTGGRRGQKEMPAHREAGLKGGLVCLTNEQLQKILSSVQTSSRGSQTGKQTGSSMNDGRAGMKGEERGGGGEEKQREEDDTPERSEERENRLSGCLFSWMDERESESRATLDARRAQWRRELDEQVALKQQKQTQRSAPSRLQAEEDTDSLLSVQSSFSHSEQPAAIRSSLRLGEVTPMEEMLSVERREEQRRRWLEELDRQREETTERRRREKLLQSQVEDHELWAAHFDSLHRKLPDLRTTAPSAPSTPSAPPPAPSNSSERGEWEPSSSLSLVWEAMSSCGAESVGGASMDTTSGYPNRASHLRTMTALLDPAQIEERERRRLKQLEQQRDIEAQMGERRRLREEEEARRREEEEDEERRVAQERERMERQYKLERERQKSNQQAEELKNQDEKSPQQTSDNRAVTNPDESLEEKEVDILLSLYKDTAVQTEEAPSLPLLTEVQPPPSLLAAASNSRNRAGRAGKENICVPGGGGGGGEGGGGGDPYEAFARTERNSKDKRRPEWNTQRPNRRFVPASQRYPAPLQRNRQESRLKRQAELLALQERTCLSRTDPPPLPLPPPPPPLPLQDPRLLPNPTQTRSTPNRKVERGHASAAVGSDRGRSPPVPAVRHRIKGQNAPPPSTPLHPPSPPALDFIPYLRTDEVFNMDPLEPADTPPPRTHTEAPLQSSASPPTPPPPLHHHQDPLLHPELRRTTQTLRQQEILRGLAQLRQGLLQKQRELETDLNPLLKRHENELRASSVSHRM